MPTGSTTLRDGDRSRALGRPEVVAGLVAPVVGLMLAVVLMAAAGGAGLPLWLQLLPFAVSAIFLGMPHGALDGVVVARMMGRPLWSARVQAWLLLYLTVSVATVGAWQIAPAAAFAFFIGLTWLHWGQGDLWYLMKSGHSTHLERRWQRVTALVSRGAIPMMAPLAFHTEDFRQTYLACVEPFSGSIPAVPAAFWGWAPLLGLGLLAVSVGGHLLAVAGEASEKPLSVGLDVLELAVLVAFFAAVPPIFAVGVYFCVWHSVRHILRVARFEREGEVGRAGRGPEWSDIGRAFVDAVPFTAIALVGCAVLAYYTIGMEAGGMSWLGIYLVAISALTVPHVAVVTLLDLREQLWRRSSPDV